MFRKTFSSLAAMMFMAGLVQAQTAPVNPVVHVEVLGVDAPRLQKFYGDLFGWPVTLNPIGYGYVPVEPRSPLKLTGGVGPSPQKQALVTFYVKVENIDAMLKRAQQLGGKTAMPATQVPGGITFARIADPEGNIVGLVQRPD